MREKKINIYIVQGDPRDHSGEILLVTRDEEKAKLLCRTKIRIWNKVDKDIPLEIQKTEVMIWEDSKKLDLEAFLDKYLGQAWICSPQLLTYKV